jgi:sulfur carrier protein ThiS
MLFGRREPIQVTVVVHGPAARLLKAGTYELRSGDKVKALLKRAGLDRGAPGLSCLIEGERVDLSRKLTGGETVTVLQMVAGG